MGRFISLCVNEFALDSTVLLNFEWMLLLGLLMLFSVGYKPTTFFACWELFRALIEAMLGIMMLFGVLTRSCNYGSEEMNGEIARSEEAATVFE